MSPDNMRAAHPLGEARCMTTGACTRTGAKTRIDGIYRILHTYYINN